MVSFSIREIEVKFHLYLYYFAMLTTLSGCVYRFTNQHIVLPPGIRTIAIEAVYDTSREVLPHDLLWEALQEAFAADGHLRVVSQGRADALVRAHITRASDGPTGSAESKGSLKDSKGIAIDQLQPSDFRLLPEAGEFTTKQELSISVEVEVIDLRSRESLFNKSYQSLRTFRSFRSETSVAQRKSHFLFFEEARAAKFSEMSKDIAKAVVRDFLVGR
jgi:hypothetical protein